MKRFRGLGAGALVTGVFFVSGCAADASGGELPDEEVLGTAQSALSSHGCTVTPLKPRMELLDYWQIYVYYSRVSVYCPKGSSQGLVTFTLGMRWKNPWNGLPAITGSQSDTQYTVPGMNPETVQSYTLENDYWINPNGSILILPEYWNRLMSRLVIGNTKQCRDYGGNFVTCVQ